VLFIYADTPEQIAATFILTTATLLHFIHIKPFVDPGLDATQMMSLGTQTVTLFYALMKKVQEMKNQLNELGTEDSVMTFIIVLLNMMLLSVPLYKAVQAKKDEIIGYYNLFMEKTGLRKEEEKVYRAGYDDDNPSRKGGLIGAAGTFQAEEVEEDSLRSYSGGPGIFGPSSGGSRSDMIVHGLPQQLSITSADQVAAPLKVMNARLDTHPLMCMPPPNQFNLPCSHCNFSVLGQASGWGRPGCGTND